MPGHRRTRTRTRALPFATLSALATFALPTLHAAPASASPLLDLTGDTAGTGGLQARSVPSSSAAAYFNPALLTDSDAGLQLGFFFLSQQIAITLDGRPGTEFAVPEGISNAGRADTSRFENYPLPTNELQFGREESAQMAPFEARPRQGAGTGHQVRTYASFGMVAKLFEERLALGIHTLLPNGELTQLNAFFSDEREQYFSNSLHPELYGDRLTALSIGLGAGVKLAEGLSLGVGASLSIEANATAPTYVVDTGNLERILIDLDADAQLTPSPHFGLSYQPTERLRLVATAHAPTGLDVHTGFTFLLASGVEQASSFVLRLHYTPWQLGAGASIDLLHGDDRAVTLAGTLVYATWSEYVDRHGERPGAAYPWADTLSPTLGVRSRWGDIGAFVDLGYTPTPVPPQTGRTNYVDNDRVSAAGGGELAFSLFGARAAIGLQLQLHSLLSRRQGKIPTPTRPDGDNIAPELVWDEVPDDAQISGEPLEGAEGLQTNNPGWPGFESDGWLLGTSVFLKVST